MGILIIICILFATNVDAQVTDAKSKSLLKSMEKVNGGWNKISAKKDVEFTYIYDDKSKGQDISLERHIFDGEQSWASYEQHAVNVFPGLPGTAKQSLIDGVPQVTLGGKTITDEQAVGGTVFLRRVNFYWFTMMYKLQNHGTIYKHLGTEDLNGITYDKVSLKYDSNITGKKLNDEYILYFNPNTHLVDLFYFSLPDFGVMQPILRMECSYETVDGILLTTVRRAFGPNAQGEYNLMGEYTVKNVKFNNGFKVADFKL